MNTSSVVLIKLWGATSPSDSISRLKPTSTPSRRWTRFSRPNSTTMVKSWSTRWTKRVSTWKFKTLWTSTAVRTKRWKPRNRDYSRNLPKPRQRSTRLTKKSSRKSRSRGPSPASINKGSPSLRLRRSVRYLITKRTLLILTRLVSGSKNSRHQLSTRKTSSMSP